MRQRNCVRSSIFDGHQTVQFAQGAVNTTKFFILCTGEQIGVISGSIPMVKVLASLHFSVLSTLFSFQGCGLESLPDTFVHHQSVLALQ